MKLRTLVLLFGIGSFACADNFIVYGSRAAQNPTDILDWNQLGPSGNELSAPQLVSSFEGKRAQVGTTNYSDFLRVDEGIGWGGNFNSGEPLVWTGNSNFGLAGLGPMALEFQHPLGSFGFAIQADLYGAFSTTVRAYDIHGTQLFHSTFHGVSNGLGNGSALFVGMGDTTGVNIRGVSISTDSGDPAWNNDFAISDPSMTYAPAPEPGSVGLALLSALLGGAAMLGCKLRNRGTADSPQKA